MSNENQEAIDVHWDDFTVVHGKTNIVSTQDYYPFGLTFNESKRTGSTVNRMNTFQDQEYEKETGWVKFKWRNHQPDIGRFFNVDPLAEDYVHNSVYAFSENRVVDGVELEGLEYVRSPRLGGYDQSGMVTHGSDHSFRSQHAILPAKTSLPKRMTIGPSNGHHPSMSRETMMIADGIGYGEMMIGVGMLKKAPKFLKDGFKNLRNARVPAGSGAYDDVMETISNIAPELSKTVKNTKFTAKQRNGVVNTIESSSLNDGTMQFNVFSADTPKEFQSMKNLNGLLNSYVDEALGAGAKTIELNGFNARPQFTQEVFERAGFIFEQFEGGFKATRKLD